MSKKGYAIELCFIIDPSAAKHSSFIETITFDSCNSPYDTNYFITVVANKGPKAALVFETLEQTRALLSLLAPEDQEACTIIDLDTGEVIL